MRRGKGFLTTVFAAAMAVSLTMAFDVAADMDQ